MLRVASNDRVCAPCLGDDGLVAAQGRGIEHLDDPGVPDRDVEPAQRPVEEHDVGHARDGLGREDLAAVGLHLEQHARVTRAEEPTALDVDVQPVRPGVGDRHHAADGHRIAGPHDGDLRWVGDVDVEYARHRIVDRPARASGDGDVGDPLAAVDVDDRDGVRAGNGWIADVSHEKPRAPGS